jgi:hypothetical protein
VVGFPFGVARELPLLIPGAVFAVVPLFIPSTCISVPSIEGYFSTGTSKSNETITEFGLEQLIWWRRDWKGSWCILLHNE